jgi:Tol biopolymer transport system component
MKFRAAAAALFLAVFGIVFMISWSSTGQKDFPVLKGPYLGQKPPGLTAEIFAPGIVSTGFGERCVNFSPDGLKLYYAVYGPPHSVILFMREDNGLWTKPQVAPFSGQYTEEFTISPDGRAIVFTSNRPRDGKGEPRDNFFCWIIERSGKGWGNPKYLDPLINAEDSFAGYPSLTQSGHVYFYSDRQGGMGGDDIWMSPYDGKKHGQPINLGDSINTEQPEADPFIAPDESYIIFCRRNAEFEDWDLFISFRKNDGTWTTAAEMGSSVNSRASEFCPSVSPGGKYFFFTSTRSFFKNYSEVPITYEEKIRILNSPGNGDSDIYWVDAGIIEHLKPDKLKLNSVSKGTGGGCSWPHLRGPYLGQKTPSEKAGVFMDGIISVTNEDQMCAAFTEDGKEFYYNARHNGNWAIFMTKETGGQWTKPAPLPFTSNYTDRDFTMSPDGNKILFGSNRPQSGEMVPSESLDIFMTERLPTDQWSEPKNLYSLINTKHSENYPSMAQNGNLYFFSYREEGLGGCDIFVSRLISGRYQPPENLGAAVNSDKHDWDAVVAPDESWIIFSSQDRPDSIGRQDLYISFRKKDGGWTEAKNMGPAVNSSHDEICPSLSLDGKHLFFTSRRRGMADIFWIKADIIRKLKVEGLE